MVLNEPPCCCTGHDVDGDLCDGVGVQAERGAALGHHAADEVVPHREHDVKREGWDDKIEFHYSTEEWLCIAL